MERERERERQTKANGRKAFFEFLRLVVCNAFLLANRSERMKRPSFSDAFSCSHFVTSFEDLARFASQPSLCRAI
jgi:hypothetical protein